MCLHVFKNLQLATTPVCPQHCAGLNFNICFSYLIEFTRKNQLLGPGSAFVIGELLFHVSYLSAWKRPFNVFRNGLRVQDRVQGVFILIPSFVID